MVCTAHRLQCKILHYPKHKFPIQHTECSNAPEINCNVMMHYAQHTYSDLELRMMVWSC